ncbi:MAG: SPFH domain-containing protein [Planctomycetota bacterium]|jgi:regulator of protease activity HflC (stomatin/prohibitin superfamily)|nr:SPFH domain-containing protein [Planctomycetota bacterium]
MFAFTVGLLLIICAGFVAVLHRTLFPEPEQRIAAIAGCLLAIVFGCGMTIWSTAIYVEDNQGGVVVRKFGPDLDANRIIATNGEKGPQAKVLPPGWHFFYWPFLYDLEQVDNVDIPKGQLGVITARDGQGLPDGEVFAPAWNDDNMLDAQHFLTEANGFRGPQLAILSPGQYRYNPRLFQIDLRSVLEVAVGEVAVIKANAGPIYEPAEGETIEVNGTPIVPVGYRGIWREAYTPNAYYLHPDAYVVTKVMTINRVYEYAADQAIAVRTKDGFEFPVDIRVSVKISAQHAPYVVAKLAEPDAKEGNFTVLEQRVILPLVRAIFRNTAEGRNALEFVNQRSDIEMLATQKLREGLEEYKIETDGVYVADIRIGDSEQGRRLLTTQTDREVAQQEQETFREKERAQMARSDAVRAEEEANQQVEQAQARSRVIIAQEDAKALVAKAEGEASAYKKKMEALGGVDNFIHLEITKMAMEKWGGTVPRVFTVGGSGGDLDPTAALIGSMLDRMSKEDDIEENNKP